MASCIVDLRLSLVEAFEGILLVVAGIAGVRLEEAVVCKLGISLDSAEDRAVELLVAGDEPEDAGEYNGEDDYREGYVGYGLARQRERKE